MPRRVFFAIAVFLFCFPMVSPLAAAPPPPSSDTEECLGCHEDIHPGIVADWRKSLHAAGPARAGKDKGKAASSVGCAECHTAREEKHRASFPHNGFSVHVDVSPADCAECHGVEAGQYSENLMSHAYGNLMGNSVYRQLINASAGPRTAPATFSAPGRDTMAETCLYCHGTNLAFNGTVTRDTDLGEMEFPVLAGWPNQGVGRVNTDGSRGSCSACHPRHGFSAAMARKPYTCKQCHEGPDVPAFKVYQASKHGNIMASSKADYAPSPWKAGTDFPAPTCAACHISETATPDGTIITERTHRINDRLSYRLFGVPYATAHPKSPDLSIIRNSQGQPLTADLSGKPAEKYLIDSAEQEARSKKMQALCLACHSGSWVAGHFARLEKSVAETNQATLSATKIMEELWARGKAKGLAAGENPFDEPPEFTWTRVFLFYANSSRFAAAMSGGGDYAVFADGRFQLNQAIAELGGLLPREPSK